MGKNFRVKHNKIIKILNLLSTNIMYITRAYQDSPQQKEYFFMILSSINISKFTKLLYTADKSHINKPSGW